jgi:hypothetical protein
MLKIFPVEKGFTVTAVVVVVAPSAKCSLAMEEAVMQYMGAVGTMCGGEGVSADDVRAADQFLQTFSQHPMAPTVAWHVLETCPSTEAQVTRPFPPPFLHTHTRKEEDQNRNQSGSFEPSSSPILHFLLLLVLLLRVLLPPLHIFLLLLLGFLAS